MSKFNLPMWFITVYMYTSPHRYNTLSACTYDIKSKLQALEIVVPIQFHQLKI
jgi:hypothetical protein